MTAPSPALQKLIDDMLIFDLRREFLQRAGRETIDPHIAGAMYYSRIIQGIMKYGPNGQIIPEGVEPYWDGSAWQRRPATRQDGQPYNDDWGDLLVERVRSDHAAGTTITDTLLTCPDGYDIRIIRTVSVCSRTPDATCYTNTVGLVGENATPQLLQYLARESGNVRFSYPDVSPADNTNTADPSSGPNVLYPGDSLALFVSNNQQAGDYVDSLVVYQKRRREPDA